MSRQWQDHWRQMATHWIARAWEHHPRMGAGLASELWCKRLNSRLCPAAGPCAGRPGRATGALCRPGPDSDDIPSPLPVPSASPIPRPATPARPAARPLPPATSPRATARALPPATSPRTASHLLPPAAAVLAGSPAAHDPRRRAAPAAGGPAAGAGCGTCPGGTATGPRGATPAVQPQQLRRHLAGRGTGAGHGRQHRNRARQAHVPDCGRHLAADPLHRAPAPAGLDAALPADRLRWPVRTAGHRLATA